MRKCTGGGGPGSGKCGCGQTGDVFSERPIATVVYFERGYRILSHHFVTEKKKNGSKPVTVHATIAREM